MLAECRRLCRRPARAPALLLVLLVLLPLARPCASASASASAGSIVYTYVPGFLDAGNDLPSGPMTYAEAAANCSATLQCMGFTWAGSQADPQPTARVNMYLKASAAASGSPGWNAWLKGSTPEWPDVNASVGDLAFSLRPGTHTVDTLAFADARRDWSSWHNFSWLPAVGGRSLPGCHQLGDVTLRTQALAAGAGVFPTTC